MGLNVKRFIGMLLSLVVFFFLVDMISPVEIKRKSFLGIFILVLICISSYLLSLEGE